MGATREARSEGEPARYLPIGLTNATGKSCLPAKRVGGFVHIAYLRVEGFFASVEQVMRPKFCGKPVLVGEDVVVSASYEAKFLGVKNGMSVAEALRLCPNAIVLAGRYGLYAEYAECVRAIGERFTPAVEADARHGFYLDFRGSDAIDQDFPGTLRRLQLEIRKRTGLSVSVGAGSTRAVAAIASRIEQPRGLRIVARGKEEDFLGLLPVEAFDGIGEIEAAELRKRGVSTMAALRRVPLASLATAYGDVLGRQIWKNSRGVDVPNAPKPAGDHVLSRQICVGGGTVDADYLGSLTEYLSKRISLALCDKRLQARTVGLRIRCVDRFTVSQSLRLACPSNDDCDLRAIVGGLLGTLFTRGVAVRALEVTASRLVSLTAADLHLPSTSLSPGATA